MSSFYNNRMKKIAFLISIDYERDLLLADGKFFNEYDFLKVLFKEKSWDLEKVIWDKEANWSQYSAIIFKSIWDYYERPREFKVFLNDLRKIKSKFCNSLDTVSWNMDKNYLFDIESDDLPVIPFKLMTSLDKFEDQLFLSLGEDIVIKPTISGGSRHTLKCKSHEWQKHLPLMQTILQESALLIQPFVPEVTEEGEYSFLFFQGEFSHALLKKPKAGDFRAHSFFGGNNYSYEANAEEIKAVSRFLDSAPDFPDYARVDVVRRKGIFHLMELELIEPYLYFETAKDQKLSGIKFVEAIIKGT
jgi:glutathione synthase/RimK-type ligase-like ATP-grasp enzyme